MRYYPLFLDLQGHDVLLVGAGSIALRKLELLQRVGATVRVIAPEACPEIAAFAAHDVLQWSPRRFAASDVDGTHLVIAATDDPQVNAAVAAAARARRIPVNVVDQPALCSAILPAVVDRDPIVVAIGSNGAAPVLARRLRERIEILLEPSLGALAALCARWRGRVRERLPRLSQRRAFWESVIDGAPATALRDQRPDDAERELDALLSRHDSEASTLGEVVLVGAGPGDPGLLTLHALRALQDADVVFHDALVSRDVLDLVRRDARKVAVGKRGGALSVGQSTIHQHLLDAARRGERVVRLKGGDPLTFARGGEELQFLRAHGVRYRVIPGITAAAACAAHAGIPLTHREHAQALQLVTAHGADTLDALDWRALAAPRQTLAVYMGVAVADAFAARLQAAGAPGSTPVAIIENGSRAEQRVLLCRLDALPQQVQQHKVCAPALLLVGAVAALATELHWFGEPPTDLLQDEPRARIPRAA